MAVVVAIMVFYLVSVNGQLCIDETFSLTYRDQSGTDFIGRNMTVAIRTECILWCHQLDTCVSMTYGDNTGLCLLHEQMPELLSLASQSNTNIYYREGALPPSSTEMSSPSTTEMLSTTTTEMSSTTTTEMPSTTTTEMSSTTTTEMSSPSTTEMPSTTTTEMSSTTTTEMPSTTTTEMSSTTTTEIPSTTTTEMSSTTTTEMSSTTTTEMPTTTTTEMTSTTTTEMSSTTTTEMSSTTTTAQGERQWAASVYAVSSYYNNYPTASIRGAPDVYPLYGLYPGAWAQYYHTANEYIVLRYELSLLITEINIYETFKGGAVWSIQIRNTVQNYYEDAYQASTNQVRYTASRIFRVPVTNVNFPSDWVKIWIDARQSSGGPMHVDAVEVVGMIP